MYYAEINTLSDRLSAMVLDTTIIGTIKSIIQWRKDYRIPYEDIDKIEIRDRETDLFILGLKFIKPNAVEFDY